MIIWAWFVLVSVCYCYLVRGNSPFEHPRWFKIIMLAWLVFTTSMISGILRNIR